MYTDAHGARSQGAQREVEALGGLTVASAFRSLAEEHADLLERAALLPAPWEGCLDFSGRDWRSFLHNLLTQDIRGLTDATVRPSAFADRKGHLLADLWVGAAGSEGRVRLRVDRRDLVLGLLERHRFSEQVTWSDPRRDHAAFLLLGPRAEEAARHAGLAVDDRSVGRADEVDWLEIRELERRELLLQVPARKAEELIARLAPHAPLVGFDAFHLSRLERGIAWFGFEADESRLVPETGLADRISYNKGCYLGQETLARLHYQGSLNWKLVRLSIESAVESPPVDLVNPGQERVGWIASLARGLDGRFVGLGYLHRKARDNGDAVSLSTGAPVEIRGEVVPPEPGPSSKERC